MPLQVWVCKTSHCALVCVCVRVREICSCGSLVNKARYERHAHVFRRGKTSKWGSCVPPRPAYCRLPSRKPFSVRTDSLSCWHLLVTKFSTYPCLKKMSSMKSLMWKQCPKSFLCMWNLRKHVDIFLPSNFLFSPHHPPLVQNSCDTCVACVFLGPLPPPPPPWAPFPCVGGVKSVCGEPVDLT